MEEKSIPTIDVTVLDFRYRQWIPIADLIYWLTECRTVENTKTIDDMIRELAKLQVRDKA